MKALDRDTKDALRLCYDFMQIYGDLFMDSDFYRMKRDYVMVRNNAVAVLRRHEKKTRKPNENKQTT